MAKRCRVYKPQSMAKGGNLEKIRQKPGMSNAGKYPGVKDFAGPHGTYPINTIDRGRSALKLAHNSSNPEAIKSKVYSKYPSLKKQKGGEPTMTQDSQKDPVHIEKTNNFVSWLHQSKEEAKVQQMMEEDMARIDSGEYQIGGNIDERSGYESGDYGQKKDINLGYFQAAAANMPGIMESIATTASGLNAMGVFNKKKGNGEQQPQNGETTQPEGTQSPIDAMPDEGFGSKQLDTFGRNTDKSFGQPNPSGVKLDESFNKPVGGFNPMLYAEDGVTVADNTAHIAQKIPPNKRILKDYAQDVDYDAYPWLKGTPKYNTEGTGLSHKDKWTRGAASKMEEYRTKMKDARAKVHEAYGIDQASWEANPNLELDRYKTNEAGERLIGDEVWADISAGLDAEKAYQRRMGFKEFDVRGRKQRESNVPMDVPSGELATGRRYMTGWAPGYKKKAFDAPAVIDQPILAEAQSKRRVSPMFKDPVSLAYGGMIHAQSGVSYPGAQPLWDPNDTDTSGEAFEAYMKQQGPDPEPVVDPFAGYQTEQDFNQNQMEEFEPGGPDDPTKKKGKGIFGMGDPNKSNAQHQTEAMGAITTMKGITGIAGYADKRKREEEIRNRMSNVFETHDVSGADRGDYLANVPGIGTNFRPDETTRMGYNTKIAQEGGEYENYITLPQHIDSLPRAERKFQQAVFDDEGRNWEDSELDWIKESMKRDKNPAINKIASNAAFYATHPRMAVRTAYNRVTEPFYKQQGGEYNMDDELELSEAEINSLIAQGYNLEYID